MQHPTATRAQTSPLRYSRKNILHTPKLALVAPYSDPAMVCLTWQNTRTNVRRDVTIAPCGRAQTSSNLPRKVGRYRASLKQLVATGPSDQHSEAVRHFRLAMVLLGSGRSSSGRNQCALPRVTDATPKRGKGQTATRHSIAGRPDIRIPGRILNGSFKSSMGLSPIDVRRLLLLSSTPRAPAPGAAASAPAPQLGGEESGCSGRTPISSD
jgi:hypothetical protein